MASLFADENFDDNVVQRLRVLGHDVLTVQEEIATAVSDKLRLRPTTDEQKRLTRRSTENPE